MTLDLPDDPVALVFEQDPLTLPKEAIARVVAEFRRRRSAFHSEEAAKALKPAKSKAPKPDPATASALLRDKPLGEINLEDLD